MTVCEDQITRYNQALSICDGQIAGLNQAMAERDGIIQQILGSTSWRLTRPLRILKALFFKKSII